MSAPLLSVCLITYNHAKYIRQAIDGVLMQQVGFTWELIIADDFSTDGTREILLEYKTRYPDFIRLILQVKNVGAAQNWLDLIRAPRSKYIAYFEGDDYWTDPLKLQKQVDYLERDSACVAVFHDVEMKTARGTMPSFIQFWNKGFVPENRQVFLEEILDYAWLIPTGSLVFRRDKLFLPDGIESMPNGDFPLIVSLAGQGPFFMFKEVMGCYRRNNLQSISTNRHALDRLAIRLHRVELFLDLYERGLITDRIFFARLIRKEVGFLNVIVNALQKNPIFRTYLRASVWLKNRT
jgi:glycosyltransferase involved in cell wall biosynthesis